jgi:hypothetical protein
VPAARSGCDYLDSCAVMTVVRAEGEFDALREWLVTRADKAVVTSELGRVEVLRAARRLAPGPRPRLRLRTVRRLSLPDRMAGPRQRSGSEGPAVSLRSRAGRSSGAKVRRQWQAAPTPDALTA